MDKAIKPINCLRGEITVPGDKSISHRAVFTGSIAKGVTVAENFLEADDCLRTVRCFRAMGIDIGLKGKKISIAGGGLRGLHKPAEKLFLGNSGTTMRILPGVLAGQDFEAILTGDESLSARPMERIVTPLKKMGVNIRSENKGLLPPLFVKGGSVKAVKYSTNVASAQVKSCILFAGLFADGVTSVTEPFASRDHTERMLGFYGAQITKRRLTVSVEGKPHLSGRKFFIPGDISSAAFFIAGACILRGSEVTIRNVGLNPTRTGFLRSLSKMGAKITVTGKTKWCEPCGDISVKFAPLKSAVIEAKGIPLLIDEVPILAVLASRAEGKTVIKGISELRVKETDRISAITENLSALGVDIRSEKENLIITGGKKRFKKADLNSFKDHRMAMSMAIAALGADGECKVRDVDCINTSFPEFFETLRALTV